MTNIHPTSLVDPKAQLGQDVVIGPFCTIGPEVIIEDRTVLVSHVVVDGKTRIGADSSIDPFCRLGGPPQHLGHKGGTTELVMGHHTIVREHVIMHTGTDKGGGVTKVGDHCLFMAGSGIAHDCLIGNSVIFANQASCGGHVEVEDFVFLGGSCAVHQFARLGRYAFIGGGAIVTKDVIPFGSVWGNHARLEGLNLVGLKRRGFQRDQILNLRTAYRLMFADEGNFQERLDDVMDQYGHSPEVVEIVSFIRKIRRALYVFPLSKAQEPHMPQRSKLALIAGGGQVPLDVIHYLEKTQRDFVVIRLKDITDAALARFDGIEIGLGDFAHALGYLQQSKCQSVCLVGNVKRPNFATMERDTGGQAHLGVIEQAGRQGDDSLLRQVAQILTQYGLKLEGAHEANPELLLTEGLMAGSLNGDLESDIQKAVKIAKAIGALDIGQAAIVARGLVIAVEAQEGTQAMLNRVAGMPAHIRSQAVLAKIPKPIQDLRLDMPTIGPQTIIDAKAAGLAGIVGMAGQLLLADRQATLAQAQADQIFIYGLNPHNYS